jgi:hypothetical protein
MTYIEVKKLLLKNLIDNYSNEETAINNYIKKNKKIKCKDILTYIDEQKKNLVKKTQMIKNKEEEPEEKVKLEIFDAYDKVKYKKLWNKLKPFHKIEKLTEFVNESDLNKKEKTELLEELKEKLENKTLKGKDITYSIDLGRIIKIKKYDISYENLIEKNNEDEDVEKEENEDDE